MGAHAVGAQEAFEDAYGAWRYSGVFGARAFDPRQPFQISFERDVALAFFHGLGDIAYGLPFYRALGARLRANGRRLIAASEVSAYGVSNAQASSLLSELAGIGVFDEVLTYRGMPAEYWKFHDWTMLDVRVDATAQILPFIYPTARHHRSRLAAIAWQHGIQADAADYHLDLGARAPSAALSSLLQTKLSGPPVLIHFDARSSGYRYPYIDVVIEFLVSRGFHVLSLTSHDFSSPLYTVLPVGRLSVFDTLQLLSAWRPKVISVNSLTWPLAMMTKLDLLGFYMLRGDDGHQFAFPTMRMFSPSSHSAAMNPSVRHARRTADYVVRPQASGLIDYRPGFVLRQVRDFLGI